MSLRIEQIPRDGVVLLQSLMTLFGEAFAENETYVGRRPSAAYQQRLLELDYFIALVAFEEGILVGGLAAYELVKFEQERSEIYIYDLAVHDSYRRQGIATALLHGLQRVAKDRGAYVIFVQADTAIEDQPAVALYSKLGHREEVLHFDISV